LRHDEPDRSKRLATMTKSRTSEPQLRQGHPIWLSDTQGARQSYPSLRGRFDCEVAIVGGGITGALAALTFAT
jgi:hypothetical protein